MHLLPQRIHLGAHRERTLCRVSRRVRDCFRPLPLQSHFASLFSQRHRITLYLGEWDIRYASVLHRAAQRLYMT